MNKEKVTKRDYFTFISEVFSELQFDEEPTISASDVMDFCEKEIALLDKKAAKAKENAAKKKDNGDALMEQVFECLSDEEFEPIAVITERIDDDSVSVAKVQYRLTKLAKEGRAEKGVIKLPATETAKARTIVGYRKMAY